VPTLVVGADRDTLTPWATAVEPSYAALTAEPRYLAGLENAGHFSFTDFCDLLPASGNNGCEEDFRPPAEVLVTLRTLSLAFLQVQMGHADASVWMPPEEGMSSWEGVED
jgi:predicted dienelactone hydrolase